MLEEHLTQGGLSVNVSYQFSPLLGPVMCPQQEQQTRLCPQEAHHLVGTGKHMCNECWERDAEAVGVVGEGSVSHDL